jgi:hypothetical protein
MRPELRQAAAELRSKSSAEAADWLLAHHPVESADAGKAIVLLEHLSFERRDARRLAEHYLSKLPHASDRAYRVFVRLLPLNVFLCVIRGHLPIGQQRRDLLLYYLEPVLRERVFSSESEQAVQSFLAALQPE